jgi:hypothetical protein
MTRAEMLIVRRITLPTGPAKVHVDTCVAAGKCLGCGEEPASRRGLGTRCYHAWRSARQKLNQTQAANYDAKLIKAGKLLPPQQILALRAPNVFRDAALSVSGE